MLPVGKLTITVHGCKGLRNDVLIGQMSSYVQVQCSHEKFQTSVAKDQGSNPNFDFRCVFNLNGSDANQNAVHFYVVKDVIGPDSKLARADIPVTVLIGTKGPKEFELSNINDFRSREGHVVLSCSYSPDGAPPKEEHHHHHHNKHQQEQEQQQQQTSPSASAPPAYQPLQPLGQPMMMGQQPMMMGQQPMMMGQQPMMMGQQPMMMGQQPMMMGQQPMMMGQQPMMMGMGMGMSQPMMGMGMGQPMMSGMVFNPSSPPSYNSSSFSASQAFKMPACVIQNQGGVCITIKSVHNGYLHADKTGAVGARIATDDEGLWFMQRSPTNQASFRSVYGRYLHPGYSGGAAGTVVADQTIPYYFSLDRLSDTEFALKSNSHKYLAAGHNHSIHCNRESRANEEKFTVEFQLLGPISFLSDNGRYLAVASQTTRFAPLPQGPNKYVFSCNGSYLRVENGLVTTNSQNGEIFEIILGFKAGTVGIKTTTRQFLRFGQNGSPAIHHELTPLESFQIVHV